MSNYIAILFGSLPVVAALFCIAYQLREIRQVLAARIQ